MYCKHLKIETPEGYEIDLETSNLSEGIVRFKPKKVELSYSRIAKELFRESNPYFTDILGDIVQSSTSERMNDPNNATTREQLECLMVHNKLRNVAEYLGVKDGIEIQINQFLLLKATEILGEDEVKKALFIYK